MVWEREVPPVQVKFREGNVMEYSVFGICKVLHVAGRIMVVVIQCHELL